MLEEQWFKVGEEIALRRLDSKYVTTDDDYRVLEYIRKRWSSRKVIAHSERRCALRLALGIPCSCELGCRCPQQGCGDPVTLGECSFNLPIYGESTFDAILRRHRRSWRFGHFIDAKRGFLFHCLDEHEDPYTCSWEDAQEYVETLIAGKNDEPPHPGYASNLRDDLRDTWERFALALARRDGGEFMREHRCHTVLGAPIPRGDWPKMMGIYAVRANDRLKIGWGKNIAKRLTGQQCFCPYPLELVAFVPDASVKDEKAMHKQLARSRLVGEWFAIDQDVIRAVSAMMRDKC